MLCERTLRQIDDFHMWFSSGATESSQHFDTHDNLLGMIDGNKQVVVMLVMVALMTVYSAQIF